MLCQKCGLKEAVVHVVCVVNDKQIDKWLCSDCVEELAPSNFLSGTVFNAKEFLDGLLKPKAREEQIMNRFTERAKGILEDAMRFALDKGHDHVGTEHILLALLNVENCFAKKILEKLGIDNQAVIKELESWMGPAGSTELMISYTPRAKRALELAGEAAAAFKLHYVGSEHLLLGLLREGEGVAAQVLRRFNVTAEQVMKVAIIMLATAMWKQRAMCWKCCRNLAAISISWLQMEKLILLLAAKKRLNALFRFCVGVQKIIRC